MKVFTLFILMKQRAENMILSKAFLIKKKKNPNPN